MRLLETVGSGLAAAAAATALAAPPPEPTFDACQFFTQAEAEQAAGAPVQLPPENPKAKRPKIIPACQYSGTKDGKPVLASVRFHLAKSEAETLKAFENNRMQFQTKPLIIRGVDAAFWSGKSGEMNLRKGATWVTVAVGPDKPIERDMESARKLAEAIAKKL
jgi:hypothetical protein